MRRAPARLTIVPPAHRQTERPQLMAIVGQSNAAVAVDIDNAVITQEIELPEDRKAPNSGILLRSAVRTEITDILDTDDELDVFDMGLDADDGAAVPIIDLDPDDEVSGQHDRQDLLLATDYATDIELEPINELEQPVTPSPVQAPAADGWEMYRPITPTPPAEALYIPLNPRDVISIPAIPDEAKEPELIDLTDDELHLFHQAQALAKEMRSNPQHAFDQVAAEGKKVSRAHKRFFWDQLYQSRRPQKISKNETKQDIVAKHAQAIETIAYQVVRYERSQKCYYLVALEFGFQCLPAYADPNVKDALQRALRQKVEMFREVVVYMKPLQLKTLTPDTVYMLAPADKALAETVVKTVNQAIKEKKTELALLKELAAIDPTQSKTIWHFYQLLKKPDPQIKSIKPQAEIPGVYQRRIASIADQLVAEMNGEWQRIDGVTMMGFQMLPQNVDAPTDAKLRGALMRAVQARVKLAELSKELPIITPEMQTVLEKLVGRILEKFSAEPFNADKHVNAAWQELNTNQEGSKLTDLQKAALLPVLRSKISAVRAEKKAQLTARVQQTKERIAATPHLKPSILQQAAQGMSPLDTILFHEMIGQTLLNSTFGDHQRLRLSPTKPQPAAPLLAQKIDDQSIAFYRQLIDAKVPKVKAVPPPVPQIARPETDQPEELDSELLEEQPTTLWQSLTSAFSRGAKHISNWWESVKTSVSEFSFMDFIRGHKSVVGATTVLAALNAYQGYTDFTRVVEVASVSNTIANDANDKQPEMVRYQTAAFSQPLGLSETGRPRILNYAPVHVSTLDMPWHHHGLFVPHNLRLATAAESQQMTTAGCEAITTLHSDGQIQVISPWEYTVHETGPMANIFNALHAYMHSRTFKLAYMQYTPTPEHPATETSSGVRGDQSTIYDHLASYNPRAHHILHRVQTGDKITFGINTYGEIVIVSWYNAQMINMLAGEPTIAIRMNMLANLGEFSRSPSALARLTTPQQTTPATTVAMLTSTNE